MKLNLGCGGHLKEGYVNIDLNTRFKPDVVMDIRKLKYKDNSIDEILAYHILEHFWFADTKAVITEWQRVLKPGGIMYVIVPNAADMMRKYVNGDIQMSGLSWGLLGFDNETASPLDAHKYIYDDDRLLAVLNQVPWGNVHIVNFSECPQVVNADWQLAAKCLK